MIGASLSRWTMSYFAAALLALVAAEVMMIAGYGFPGAPVAAPETLILVHVVVIGWLSLLMCGALLQFVPVLVATPLYSNTLSLPALVSLVAGLGALILGFLQLDGRVASPLPFLPIAAVLLIAGFALILWNLGRTLAAASAVALPARFVVVGLVGVACTVTLGAIFALVLGGATGAGPLVALTAAGLPIHVVAGLGGWLTFTAMGVSYRLLAMFMLAPELEGASTRIALYLGAAALAVAIVGGTAMVLTGHGPAAALLAALALALPALGLYGKDALHLYRARRRPVIELNSRMAAVALLGFAASAVLVVVLLALGQLGERIGAVIFLTVFGWLSGLGLAQLYKIVAFLTWLECYGPVLGKAPTPRVQDLVVERHARPWFTLYFVAVGGGTVALLADVPTGFRLAAVLLLAATAGIVGQLIRTRRLVEVDAAGRFPQGARRPRLLLSCEG
jgi:hypothetical protein